MQISESEILDALQQAMLRSPSGGGYTLTELHAAMGGTKERTREAMRALLQSGKAQPVRLFRTAMDDSLRNVPGYRLVTQKKKAKEG